MPRLDLVKIRLVKDKRIGDFGAITESQEAVDFLRREMEDLDKEHLYIINLDTKCKVVNASLVAIGNINSSISDTREILKTSILSNAAGCIVLHNHPSGDPTPSKEDRQVCEIIKAAARLLSINLIDFIVVGDSGRFYSFYGNQEMPSFDADEAIRKMSLLPNQKEEEVKSGVYIERIIDGIPHKFELSQAEVKSLYKEMIENAHEKEIEKKKSQEIEF